LGTGTRAKGWINKKHVVLWRTRSLLYPRATSLSASNPFRIFKTLNLKDKIADLPQLAGAQVTLCPILNPAEDDSDPVYEIAFFAAKAARASGGGSTVPEEPSVVFKDLAQDIVFVIDTTVSMTELLQGAKDVARLSAQKIAGVGGSFSELQGKVRFGLVEYQDNTPGLYPAKVRIPLTADMLAFSDQLAKVEVANQGSQETKEDVLAGLKTAITNKEVGWADNSCKHIILLGDASAHLDGSKNTTGLSIKEVIDLAQAQGKGSESARQLASITLHAVRAINPDDESDHGECKRHFLAISENNDQVKGFYADVNPNDPDDVENIVTDLNTMLNESYDVMLKLIGTSHSRGAKPTLTDPDLTGAFARKAWILYNLSTAQENREVFTGFTTEVSENNKTVADSRTLVRFDEMKRVAANLKFIHDDFKLLEDDPDARKDVSNLLAGLQVLAASSGVGELVSANNLAEVISTLPLKSDVLKMSIDDIAVMDNRVFAQFLTNIKASEKRALTLLDNTDNWNKLIGDDTSDRAKFSFLRISELP